MSDAPTARPQPAPLDARIAAALALGLGLLHTLSFAPWNLPWLQVLALAGLFALALRAPSMRAAAWLGLAFGAGWFGLGVSWVFVSMHTYGGMPAILAALATAAFCLFLALFPAFGLALGHRIARSSATRAALGLPAAWSASEWLRGTLFTGFPWIAGGYAHSDGPLAGFAPLVGVYGLTLAASLVAGALALWTVGAGAARGRAAFSVAALALVVTGAALRTVEWTQPTGAPIRVRLVQGNIPQDLKFSPIGLDRAAETYVRLLGGPRVDLAALPESVFPLPLHALPDALVQSLIDFTRVNRSALVMGVFIEDRPGKFYNSAVGLSPDGIPPLQRYSKRHLVPFGEFVPWGFQWFVDRMDMPIGEQQHGAPYQGPMDLAGQRIAVNICYEDLFGDEIITAWRVPERAPTMLLNLSNLAWFGDTIALDQHLQISRLRAMETGRPMLRATNTGTTAVVGARGELLARLPKLSEAALDAEVRGHDGVTPYVRVGDWPAIGLTALLLVAAAGFGRRR